MSKFIKIVIDKKNRIYKNIEYLPQVILLYERFAKYLHDDYCSDETSSMEDMVIDIVSRTCPFFWVIVDKKSSQVAGFVFLDNLVGSTNKIHSAEITTCFNPKFWGFYTRVCAKKFLKYCFKNYKLHKLKASIFPQNFKVKAFLKKIGFKKEAVLKAETYKEGLLQDIEIFSVFRKVENEVKDEI